MNRYLWKKLFLSYLGWHLGIGVGIFSAFYFGADKQQVVSFLWLPVKVLPLYAWCLLGLVLASVIFASVFTWRLSDPFEQTRAKLNRLYTGQFQHDIFSTNRQHLNWYEKEDKLDADIERLRQKMLQMTSDLQELAAVPTFIGTDTKEEIIEEERRRIARELHDSVSQQLFAATLLLSTVNETLSETVPQMTVRQLQMVERVIQTAQTEMRALLLHLRPLGLDGKSLKEGLQHILQELQSKVPMDIEWTLSETQLESGNEDHLFRIVQEAISNTLRHSKATHFTVHLQQESDQLTLKMFDNGTGFDTTQQKIGSYGLLNIQERIASLGGTCQIVSEKGKGTLIDIAIPTYTRKGETL